MVKAINYILENDATVQGLVGNKSVADVSQYHKIYPVVAPQSEIAPYCVSRVVSRVNLAKECDDNYGVAVASYATSYDAVTTLNEAVISAITGHAGGSVNGMTVGKIVMTNEQDDFILEHKLYAKITTFEGAAT